LGNEKAGVSEEVFSFRGDTKPIDFDVHRRLHLGESTARFERLNKKAVAVAGITVGSGSNLPAQL
jgi:hypothetical protein